MPRSEPLLDAALRRTLGPPPHFLLISVQRLFAPPPARRTRLSSLRSLSGARPLVAPRAPAPRHLLRRGYFQRNSINNSRCHHVVLPREPVPSRSFRWQANARSVSAKAQFTSNLRVRCQALPPTVGTHSYPCVVRRGRLGNEHVRAKIPNVRRVPFCPAGPMATPTRRHVKTAVPISSPPAAPVRLTPSPMRWFRDPLDKAIKKLVSADFLQWSAVLDGSLALRASLIRPVSWAPLARMLAGGRGSIPRGGAAADRLA